MVHTFYMDQDIISIYRVILLLGNVADEVWAFRKKTFM